MKHFPIRELSIIKREVELDVNGTFQGNTITF